MQWIRSAHRQNLLLALLIIVIFGLLALYSAPFVVDDAYISFTYARNLAQGNGATYNGLWVEGYSNPLWVLLITPFLWLGVEPLTAARLLSLAAVLISFYLIGRLTERFLPQRSFVVRAIILVTLASNSALLTWTMSGMETVLALMFITLIVYLEVHPAVNNPLPSALAVVCLALTRPEGMMLFPILLVYHSLRGNYPWQRQLTWTLYVVVLFGLFIVHRLIVYGYPLPNTAYVKLGSDDLAATVSAGLAYVGSFFLVRPMLTVLLVLGASVLLAKGLKIECYWLLLAAITGGFISFAILTGGDWMPFHRFLVPVLPLLMLVMGKALDSALKRKATYYVALMLAFSALLLELFFMTQFYRPVFEEFEYHRQRLTEAGLWIREQTPPDATIAVVDAGILAYYSQRTTIDIIGLNNAHIAHSTIGSDPGYVLAQQPLLIQLHARRADDGSWYDPDSPAGNALIQDATFQSDYTLAVIEDGREGWPTFFVPAGSTDFDGA
jgi:hypothetical protein